MKRRGMFDVATLLVFVANAECLDLTLPLGINEIESNN